MYDIVANFLCSKKRQQLGTPDTFLVPVCDRRGGRAPDSALICSGDLDGSRWARGSKWQPRCTECGAELVGFFGLFREDNLASGKEAFNSRAALVIFME
ncbi:hypothetical protein CYMTET_42094 [Cymbomonas tetramitiformis]|uniref:Uncharacterized protein n=1 Tax=Cymbomonas tetramitiformis TaxID=36881 RepID=A0AAE0C6X1_9CHLO|nr:hypothetical protein CYMTET_42094 [Cymbomonas tetramitiformis]